MTEHVKPTTATAENRRFRALVPGIEPDLVYRAVRAAGGYRSWHEPTRDQYCLLADVVEIYQAGGVWVLAVTGPSVDDVREGMRLLAFGAEHQVYEVNGST